MKGFSRLTKKEKREYITQYFLDTEAHQIFNQIDINSEKSTAIIEKFSENVISIYQLPFSVAPNFLINKKLYAVPMVTEESSVVAAAAKSSGYWASRGGFNAKTIGMIKKGQVHLKFKGDKKLFFEFFNRNKQTIIDSIATMNNKMVKRGGGLKEIQILDKTNELPYYYQIDVSFDTRDAMGANYMNSCLEGIGIEFKELVAGSDIFGRNQVDIIMAILSNYSPENAVKVFVECPVNQLEDPKLNIHPVEFATRFIDAVNIAHVDINRAVTHNKGIFNGIDAVVVATGNDWRAIEANGHAYAASSGVYKSLSNAFLDGDIFHFEATLPMQVGTVGGITSIHPLARLSLKLLGNPSAEKLMHIILSVGLASNFAAVKSLVTTGIQKGHMKMHLSNILFALKASDRETEIANKYFSDKSVSHTIVAEFISNLRDKAE